MCKSPLFGDTKYLPLVLLINRVSEDCCCCLLWTLCCSCCCCLDAVGWIKKWFAFASVVDWKLSNVSLGYSIQSTTCKYSCANEGIEHFKRALIPSTTSSSKTSSWIYAEWPPMELGGNCWPIIGLAAWLAAVNIALTRISLLTIEAPRDWLEATQR